MASTLPLHGMHCRTMFAPMPLDVAGTMCVVRRIAQSRIAQCSPVRASQVFFFLVRCLRCIGSTYRTQPTALFLCWFMLHQKQEEKTRCNRCTEAGYSSCRWPYWPGTYTPHQRAHTNPEVAPRHHPCKNNRRSPDDQPLSPATNRQLRHLCAVIWLSPANPETAVP